MGAFKEMTDEQRCKAGAGLHYKSREWDRIFQDGGGWDGAWPEIDQHGRLTGRIVGIEDGYLNVNDEAMILESEAEAGGWDRPDDGYAEPPSVTAQLEERPVEGTGWYVYVGGQDAGGPFETEADAMENWKG